MCRCELDVGNLAEFARLPLASGPSYPVAWRIRTFRSSPSGGSRGSGTGRRTCVLRPAAQAGSGPRRPRRRPNGRSAGWDTVSVPDVSAGGIGRGRDDPDEAERRRGRPGPGGSPRLRDVDCRGAGSASTGGNALVYGVDEGRRTVPVGHVSRHHQSGVPT